MNEFYMYKQQSNFEQELDRLKASSLNETTKKQIENFARFRIAKGSTKLRIVKCMWCVRLMSGWLGVDFDKASKEDIITLISKIDSMDYSEHTRYDFKVVLKMFYKWLLGNDEDVLKMLKSRFEKNMPRHKGVEWSKVERLLKERKVI